MRTIDRVGKFKKDYRRESKGQHGKTLAADLIAVVNLLVHDLPLPPHYRDHALSGAWIRHRDLHLRPDLVLIYRLPDDDTLELVRIGSHAELFG